MMDSKSHPIDLVIDMQFSEGHPSNITTLMRSVIRKQHCNINRIIVISTTNYWESIFSIVQRMDTAAARLDVSFVASVEVAYAMLK
jgi:hypothetical protein